MEHRAHPVNIASKAMNGPPTASLKRRGCSSVVGCRLPFRGDGPAMSRDVSRCPGSLVVQEQNRFPLKVAPNFLL
jgi:hypothetical protein